jgi:chloramphenicol-sensitive protein RarD
VENKQLSGVLFAIGAFGLWGLTPLYFAPIRHIDSIELVLHRIAWTWVISSIYLAISWKRARAIFADRRLFLRSLLAGILILVNWLVYTYAVTKGRALEASLGYYINPLFSVVLGVVFLRERLRRLQIVAFFTAMAGVVYLTIEQGALPWVSVVLPLFFGLYGLVKKTTPVGPLLSLGFETIISGPLATAWIITTYAAGEGSLGYGGTLTTVLLLGSGFVTIAPLVFFAGATHRIALASVGFLQYIAPTLILIFGVTVLREPFPLERLPGFLLVWVALGLYSWSTFGRRRSASASVPSGRLNP